jgi:hypothetical protein
LCRRSKSVRQKGSINEEDHGSSISVDRRRTSSGPKEQLVHKKISTAINEEITKFSNMASDLKTNKVFQKSRMSTETGGAGTIDERLQRKSDIVSGVAPKRTSFVSLPKSIQSTPGQLDADPGPPTSGPSCSPSLLKPSLPARSTKPSVRRKGAACPGSGLGQIPEDKVPEQKVRSVKPAVPKRSVALPTVVTRDLNPVHNRDV